MLTMPTRFLLQENRVKGLEASYATWKRQHRIATLRDDVKAFSREVGDILHESMGAAELLQADPGQGIGFDFELLQEFFDQLLANTRTLVVALREELDGYAAETGRRFPELDETIDSITMSLAVCEQDLAKLPWYNKPWPPLDKEMQQRARSGVDGPGEPIEDILQRVLNGGSVAKG